MQLNELTIAAARKGLDAGDFSAVDLVKACLDRIEKRNPEINAFITVCGDRALEEAKGADKIIKAKKAKPLTGIPFAVKDAICTADVRSTAAAKILDNYIPPYDATVIARLRAAGAILVGKNNCDTFGHGASNENSMYGPVRNPHDLSKVAGGSSGGSAAAVADNMCLFAVGEDTGGSIRLPASFCGVVGLRPSYGRNSRYGSMPMASSLDTVGAFTKNIGDAALVEKIMAGADEHDATTVSDVVPDYEKDILENIAGLRVGIPKEYFETEGMDSEIVEIVRANIDRLEKMGCKIEEVSLPHTKYAVAVYYIVVPSEDSSNLGRMDAVRYGVRVKGKDLEELYSLSRAQGFPEEVKRRILIGTYALSAGYYDAYYKKAQKVRTLIKQDFEKVFEKVDVLIAPTVPYPAFDVGTKANDVLAMYLADVFEIPASLSGVPSISVPGGKTKSGLPVGIQIIGPRLGEGVVFKAAYNIINE